MEVQRVLPLRSKRSDLNVNVLYHHYSFLFHSILIIRLCYLIQFDFNLRVINKNIRLSLSNTDFQILTNYKDELETLYNKLNDIDSNTAEDKISQEILNEMRENVIGARKSVLDIEKRMIVIKNDK